VCGPREKEIVPPLPPGFQWKTTMAVTNGDSHLYTTPDSPHQLLNKPGKNYSALKHYFSVQWKEFQPEIAV
jgi:hypothetical protein